MHTDNIIILTKDNEFETWGSLTELCRVHGFSHNYLKSKKFPFKYRGLVFIKVKHRKKRINTTK